MIQYRTRQEIFTLAWNGLKAQGFAQSMFDDMGCAYRDGGGQSCAIGHCIPDDRYSAKFEGIGIGNFEESRQILEAAGIAPEDTAFALELQECHDDCYQPDVMQARLRTFAESYSLEVPA